MQDSQKEQLRFLSFYFVPLFLNDSFADINNKKRKSVVEIK